VVVDLIPLPDSSQQNWPLVSTKVVSCERPLYGLCLLAAKIAIGWNDLSDKKLAGNDIALQEDDVARLFTEVEEEYYFEGSPQSIVRHRMKQMKRTKRMKRTMSR
jgi:hypothetical protein